MNYAHQLRQPEWLLKRAEIIELANGVCERCGGDTADDKLEVHHGVYLKGKMAWEYPNNLLYCLCHHCHVLIQEQMEVIYLEIGKRGLELDRIKAMTCKNFETNEQKRMSKNEENG